jgi:hypothetical protein
MQTLGKAGPAIFLNESLGYQSTNKKNTPFVFRNIGLNYLCGGFDGPSKFWAASRQSIKFLNNQTYNKKVKKKETFHEKF